MADAGAARERCEWNLQIMYQQLEPQKGTLILHGESFQKDIDIKRLFSDCDIPERNVKDFLSGTKTGGG